MNAMRIAVEENNFPAGMRVLAVDDDPTSLKILENLLQKCQYNVTTTTDAKTALDRLRENPDNFDLVVTDVKMPNMDGFKLLELVGHEMNLPVIMLSVDDNPGLVLEGIKNGACDYLVKPVRIEELKNIWQHVYRKRFNLRRKGHSTALVNFDQGAENGGQQHVPYGHEEQNRKRTREWNGEGEGIDQDNRPEIDESGNPKKHRVVWSMDLHDKFVAAVNQLGMERAVPKSILELMNVEGLTRENVASHLQKYRQYLRRRDEAIGHQGNVAAQFGRNSNPYDGLTDFGALARARRYSSPYISPSYQQGGILGTVGSISNPARIPYGNTALQHAIHSYSENAMFQPVSLQPVALPTIPSTNHSRDPTLFTSAIPLATVGASLGTSGNFSVRPSGNPSSQFFQSEAATLGRLPHMQYNPQDFSSVNAVNQTPELNWGEHTQVYAPLQNQLYSPGSGVMGPSSKNFNQNNSFPTWR